MSHFTDHPEYQALWRAARADPDDRAPRLALADWLQERGWDEEAAYFRQEFSAAVWRLELAARELLRLQLDLPAVAGLVMLTDAVNKVASQIREAVAQRLREQPPARKPRPRKKGSRKKGMPK